MQTYMAASRSDDGGLPELTLKQSITVWLRPGYLPALTSVVATCYLLGVSTRRMEKLVEALGITRLSRSQVSEMARDLDEQAPEGAVCFLYWIWSLDAASWTRHAG
jgi:hypothetical protein